MSSVGLLAAHILVLLLCIRSTIYTLTYFSTLKGSIFLQNQGFFSGGTRRNGVPEPIWGNKIAKKQE
jgi:hypothetical protein